MLLGKIRAWVDSFLEKWPSKESQWSSPLANQKQGPWMLLFSTRGATSGFLSWLPVTCSWIVSSVFRHNTGISYVYQQHWRTEFLRLVLFFKASWSLFSLQFISVAKLCLTLCDLMDCSAPGFPVHHQLPELAQTHVHRVGDAVQPSILSRPLFLLPSIFPSIRVFPKESVFPSGGQSIGVSASVLPMNIQDWFPLGLTGLISLQFDLLLERRLSRVFSNTTVQKHKFFGAELSL